MDYGPTIAAAFGSYDPKEVDACREAIVECMKNTPLDNGIRATGAVKEHHERKQQEEMQQLQQHQNGGTYNNYSVNNSRKSTTIDGSNFRLYSFFGTLSLNYPCSNLLRSHQRVSSHVGSRI